MRLANHVHTTPRRTLLAQAGAAGVIGVTGGSAATTAVASLVPAATQIPNVFAHVERLLVGGLAGERRRSPVRPRVACRSCRRSIRRT